MGLAAAMVDVCDQKMYQKKGSLEVEFSLSSFVRDEITYLLRLQFLVSQLLKYVMRLLCMIHIGYRVITIIDRGCE